MTGAVSMFIAPRRTRGEEHTFASGRIDARSLARRLARSPHHPSDRRTACQPHDSFSLQNRIVKSHETRPTEVEPLRAILIGVKMRRGENPIGAQRCP